MIARVISAAADGDDRSGEMKGGRRLWLRRKKRMWRKAMGRRVRERDEFDKGVGTSDEHLSSVWQASLSDSNTAEQSISGVGHSSSYY
jgi:hypothetical protein